MQRKAGIFLHPTSLPSPYGIGDLGNEAYAWVDLLSHYKQAIWQICPLGPVGYGYSPYNCHSTFAGNDLLISPDKLKEDGLLTADECAGYPDLPATQVAYEKVVAAKNALFRTAFSRFSPAEEYETFCNTEKYWLDDYVLFMAAKKQQKGKTWYTWDPSLMLRDTDALKKLANEEQREIQYQKFLQFCFARQWQALRRYAGEKSVELFGDIPYYVAHDSSDVWASESEFVLDEKKMPIDVGGVPPDYFSADGQLWGNPVYAWEPLREQKYHWWVQRVCKAMEQVDWVRIDHFRAFESFWAVPYGSKTAKTGRWIPGPGKEFFDVLLQEIGSLPIIAEDLGMITREVDGLRTSIGIPGMRVLQFSFDGDNNNPHRPHRILHDSVIYTGTHDNNTTAGWYKQISKESKMFISRYLGCPEKDILKQMVRTAYSSVAEWCILPLQDVLGLDGRHRMNTPGTAGRGNWDWRFTNDMVDVEKLVMIAEYTALYGRDA